MTEEEEVIAFLEKHGFSKVTPEDEKLPLLKGSFDWPSCFKAPGKKPARKIALKRLLVSKTLVNAPLFERRSCALPSLTR
jgi:hypothetical protein